MRHVGVRDAGYPSVSLNRSNTQMGRIGIKAITRPHDAVVRLLLHHVGDDTRIAKVDRVKPSTRPRYRSLYCSGSMMFRGGANTSINLAGRSDTTRAECTALGGITNAAPAGQSLLSPSIV